MEDETPSWLLPTPVGAGLGAGSVSFSFCANEYLPKSRCLRIKISMFAYQNLVVCVPKSRCLRTKVLLFAYQSLVVCVPKSQCMRTKVLVLVYQSRLLCGLPAFAQRLSSARPKMVGRPPESLRADAQLTAEWQRDSFIFYIRPEPLDSKTRMGGSCLFPVWEHDAPSMGT